MEPMDFNARNIAEFRSSGGKLGGQFEGAPVLLLTTIGAKSGQQRISPMMYLPEGDRIFVFASNAGSDRHPSWYHNLRANPSATVEIGTETQSVTATEITGAEHDRLYAIQAERYPGFATYRERTDRIIPVIELIRNET
ncbi:nitroreductase family deazaflavin-dependent oxidoreductase [Mycolicibacter sp. MYC123]|uniref:Nitroreductase family deazaflavin-dependent oxidoreductase n=1 Tax=[Mycobacterium] zoologicum TaxID=2872311 RepID=A0ABU5YQH2_9MYCO|nr:MULTISPECIES: nitroreductase family deazaflavin-dependent oxidoreductase [unclassified Mycolicibacter]MEB3052324.1 nitroreductase family deazaflavin-dependent oxidoreductase [Mycolicibacter sp. MYC123]MEB3064000.1 nitroreductase family deazaflavin-dependent oxidoreductase [Mycolicibacter sp. MYC101]